MTHAIIQNDPYDSSDTVVRIELRSISTTETTPMISYTTSANCQRRLIWQTTIGSMQQVGDKFTFRFSKIYSNDNRRNYFKNSCLGFHQVSKHWKQWNHRPAALWICFLAFGSPKNSRTRFWNSISPSLQKVHWKATILRRAMVCLRI